MHLVVVVFSINCFVQDNKSRFSFEISDKFGNTDRIIKEGRRLGLGMCVSNWEVLYNFSLPFIIEIKDMRQGSSLMFVESNTTITEPSFEILFQEKIVNNSAVAREGILYTSASCSGLCSLNLTVVNTTLEHSSGDYPIIDRFMIDNCDFSIYPSQAFKGRVFENIPCGMLVIKINSTDSGYYPEKKIIYLKTRVLNNLTIKLDYKSSIAGYVKKGIYYKRCGTPEERVFRGFKDIGYWDEVGKAPTVCRYHIFRSLERKDLVYKARINSSSGFSIPEIRSGIYLMAIYSSVDDLGNPLYNVYPYLEKIEIRAGHN